MLKITKELNLVDFETWSGATDTVNYLTHDELNEIQANLKDIFPDGMDATQLNDILSFETDLIAEWLGYNDFDEIIDREDV